MGIGTELKKGFKKIHHTPYQKNTARKHKAHFKLLHDHHAKADNR